jgi:hypothetical protein
MSGGKLTETATLGKGCRSSTQRWITSTAAERFSRHYVRHQDSAYFAVLDDDLHELVRCEGLAMLVAVVGWLCVDLDLAIYQIDGPVDRDAGSGVNLAHFRSIGQETRFDNLDDERDIGAGDRAAKIIALSSAQDREIRESGDVDFHFLNASIRVRNTSRAPVGRSCGRT